jgi:L-threonylcarbamoyladenylate synthase
MDARHYAPRARLQIAATGDLGALVDACAGAGLRVGVVAHSSSVPLGSTRSDRVLERRLGSEPDAYASRLYATLHDLDDRGVDVIVVEAVPADEGWWAVADRLKRATVVE